MNQGVIVLIAEDDEGHATLIRKNLERAGLRNRFLVFRDGQEILDFFDGGEAGAQGARFDAGCSYLLLLDIRMPKVDGREVLRRMRTKLDLARIPVIMITTTDDPREVMKCHDSGCNSYIVKPVDYDKFTQAIRQLGLFLLVIEIPSPARGAESG